MKTAPAPLFQDPIFDGPTDPTIIFNRKEKTWWLIYTARRANGPACGVGWVHGTDLGVASSDDGGRTWIYRGTLNLEPYEHGRNTYWAPEVLYVDGIYHMYVSYITGIPENWNRPRHILHYTSVNLWDWKFISRLDALGDKAIDACVYPLPQGGWRLFYKNEAAGSHTQYADSHDLYNWVHCGDATNDCGQEGPNVFQLGSDIFMIADIWDGQAVYRSDEPTLTHWRRQSGKFMDGRGARTQDGNRAHHADVLSLGDKAYMFYFVHPFEPRSDSEPFDEQKSRHSALQVACLVNDGGILRAIRDEPFDFELPLDCE